jgi:hypothetical protein
MGRKQSATFSQAERKEARASVVLKPGLRTTPCLGLGCGQPQQSAQTFYRRLIERGKPHKVALVAGMRKLLAAVYSVAKHRRVFVPFF